MQTTGVVSSFTERYQQYVAADYQGSLQRTALPAAENKTQVLKLDEQYTTLTNAAVPSATGSGAIGSTMTAAITGKGGVFDLQA